MAAKNTMKRSLKSALTFVLTFALCSVLISISVVNKTRAERIKMEHLIIEKGLKANEVISSLLYKTQILSSIVKQSGGDVKNFSQLAAFIADDPAILNVLLAPNGVVSDVYPLHGNESVLGLNFFEEGAGNKEAILAVELGELVFGGPFELVQGGQALVGRLPVYLDDENGDPYFWGIVSVTLKYPQALDGAGLNDLFIQGFAYEIWRVNPDTNERQIITQSRHASNTSTHFREKTMRIANAEWIFRILPVRQWFQYTDTWILAFSALCISLLVAYVVRSNDKLRTLNSSLENLARTDSLTGICNFRHFTELALPHIERTLRLGSSSFIVMFDLDNFKAVNDTHGHQAGDAVLRDVAARVQRSVRAYDILARYGGDEFIMLISDDDKPAVVNLVNRIRLDICQIPINLSTVSVTIAATFGIAQVTPGDSLETTVNNADTALYVAKRSGRNTVAVFGE